MIKRGLLLILVAGSASFAPPVFSDDNEIGRLFFTPERRDTLDRQREFNIEEKREAQQDILAVDGVVRRAGGRSTTWVNGVPISESNQAGLRAKPDARRSSTVRLSPDPQSTAHVTIGTALNRTTGEEINPLAGGYVSKRDAAKAP